jgi:hypothetical protein
MHGSNLQPFPQVFRALRLENLLPLFEEQEIDHETLVQMEDRHFADISLPLGERSLALHNSSLLLPRRLVASISRDMCFV